MIDLNNFVRSEGLTTMIKQELYQEIGLRVAQLRIDRGLSQADIAKEFHIGQTTYSSYENGTRKIPLDLVNDLAYFFNVSPTYLFRGNEDSEREKARQEKQLIRYFSQLNSNGRTKVLEYAEDISYLRKYSSKNNK